MSKKHSWTRRGQSWVFDNAVPMARGLTASRPAEGCGPAGPAAANFLSTRFEPVVEFTKPAQIVRCLHKNLQENSV